VQHLDGLYEVDPMPDQEIRMAQVVFIVALSAKWYAIEI
jgi:hypothetical protein